jgi:hypothetical protein
LAVVEFLLSQGANPALKNKAGLMAEDYARLDPALAQALMGGAAFSDEIAVPKEKHGALIGRDGNMREEIQMECHCTLLIPPQKSENENVKILGRKEGVHAAKEKIKALMAAEAAKDGAKAPTTPAKQLVADTPKKGGKGKDTGADGTEAGGVTLRYVLTSSIAYACRLILVSSFAADIR